MEEGKRVMCGRPSQHTNRIIWYRNGGTLTDRSVWPWTTSIHSAIRIQSSQSASAASSSSF